MSVTDLKCDRCGRFLTGPGAPDGSATSLGAVRFLYHPGRFLLKDDSGLMCDACWDALVDELGPRVADVCCRCGAKVESTRSLHLHESGDPEPWQFCARHGAEFLNTLRTVDPKLDPETFTLSGDWNLQQ